MIMRTLNTEEIRLVSEINDAAQRLDIVGKAKVMGFLAGLAAGANEPPRAMPEYSPETVTKSAVV